MSEKTVYRCNQGMVCRGVDGNRYHFGAGDLVLEDHPVRPKSNGNFEEISQYVERNSHTGRRHPAPDAVVEEATSDPGQRRRVGRPRGSKNKPEPVEVPVEEQAPVEAQEEQVPDGQE